MRPRMPTSGEIGVLANRVPAVRQEQKQKRIQELYDQAFSTVRGGGSRGYPTEEGYTFEVIPAWEEYDTLDIDRERYSVSFGTSQKALSAEIEEGTTSSIDRETKQANWKKKPVSLLMRLEHTDTGEKQVIPVAILERDRIQWNESGEDGTECWRDLDIDAAQDYEPIATIRDTLEFLAQRYGES